MNPEDTNTALLDKVKQFSNIMATFGQEYIKSIVNSKQPENHALYIALLNSLTTKNDAWLNYLDRCLEIAIPLLESVGNKKAEIIGSLRDVDKFYEAFVEVEWIAKLADKKLEMRIAPFHPEEGPDIKVKVGNTEIYIEITALDISQSEQKKENMWTELQTRIKKIKSRRYVIITTNAGFSYNDVSPLVDAVKSKISELERKNDYNPTTLYYFSQNDIREWYDFDGQTSPADLQTNWQKYPLHIEGSKAKAKIVILFYHAKESNTIVGTGGAAFSELHERIKEAVLKKIRQLKKTPINIPKIVILDLSRTFADQILIGWGIYGQDAYEWLVDKRTGEMISGRNVRLNNGAFSITETVSAVIVPRRIKDNSGVHLIGDILLNPKARNPISVELLEQIASL